MHFKFHCVWCWGLHKSPRETDNEIHDCRHGTCRVATWELTDGKCETLSIVAVRKIFTLTFPPADRQRWPSSFNADVFTHLIKINLEVGATSSSLNYYAHISSLALLFLLFFGGNVTTEFYDDLWYRMRCYLRNLSRVFLLIQFLINLIVGVGMESLRCKWKRKSFRLQIPKAATIRFVHH